VIVSVLLPSFLLGNVPQSSPDTVSEDTICRFEALAEPAGSLHGGLMGKWQPDLQIFTAQQRNQPRQTSVAVAVEYNTFCIESSRTALPIATVELSGLKDALDIQSRRSPEAEGTSLPGEPRSAGVILTASSPDWLLNASPSNNVRVDQALRTLHRAVSFQDDIELLILTQSIAESPIVGLIYAREPDTFYYVMPCFMHTS
jgi:hypothetical protein